MDGAHGPLETSETERIRRLYDDRAGSYDRSCGLAERVMLGPYRRMFGSLLYGETLEVAIGSGLNLPYYGPRVTRATGVDLSEEMLAQARLKADRLTMPVTLLQADASNLPFPAESFDTVAISLALCTIPDPAAALRELARVCRPEGQIVLLEHVRSSRRLLAAAQRLFTPGNVRIIGCHLDRETFDLVASLGFSVQTKRCRLFDAVCLATARPPADHRVTLAGA